MIPYELDFELNPFEWEPDFETFASIIGYAVIGGLGGAYIASSEAVTFLGLEVSKNIILSGGSVLLANTALSLENYIKDRNTKKLQNLNSEKTNTVGFGSSKSGYTFKNKTNNNSQDDFGTLKEGPTNQNNKTENDTSISNNKDMNGGTTPFNNDDDDEGEDKKPWFLDNDGDGYHSKKQKAVNAPGDKWSNTTEGKDCDDMKYDLDNKCSKEVQVELRVFIPELVEPKSEGGFVDFAKVPIIGRIFMIDGNDSDSFRLMTKEIISFDGEKGEVNKIGKTVEFKDNAIDANKYRLKEAAKTEAKLKSDGETGIYIKAIATLSLADANFNNRIKTSKNKEVIYELSASASNPLISSPMIDYSITVTIKKDGDKYTYSIGGSHDEFPSYELKLNGTEVYSFDASKNDPSDLFPGDEENPNEKGDLLLRDEGLSNNLKRIKKIKITNVIGVIQ
ncbi:DUF3238 domain-containing protein [Flavobacteriaceae bacterium]|nr:DUF3238 domain-containing protein [Flavobacteriaceae bacterium]